MKNEIKIKSTQKHKMDLFQNQEFFCWFYGTSQPSQYNDFFAYLAKLFQLKCLLCEVKVSQTNWRLKLKNIAQQRSKISIQIFTWFGILHSFKTKVLYQIDAEQSNTKREKNSKLRLYKVSDKRWRLFSI